MSFFDDFYLTVEQRTKVLNLFPDEFKKGYRAYKQGKLNGRDFPGDTSGWYTLDPNSTIKFNINGDDCPLFIAAIPTLIDLDIARDLDQKRMAQKLLRIIIQKKSLLFNHFSQHSEQLLPFSLHCCLVIPVGQPFMLESKKFDNCCVDIDLIKSKIVISELLFILVHHSLLLQCLS